MMASASPLDGKNYYRASALDFQAGPALDGDKRFNVCVIGAGFTGLSAALELALAGLDVAVLDKGPVGWGASGRIGGKLCTGYSPGMAPFEKRLGREQAQACFDMAEEAKKLLTDRIELYGIECDLRWGYLIVANRKSHMKELHNYREEMAGYGYQGLEMLEREALREKLGSPLYHGALRDPRAGHFHPLNYCLGLADAFQLAGGRIFENTPALKLHDGQPARPARIETDKGTITADAVVLACNAYIDGLVPAIDARVMPVASYVIATEPLSQSQAQALIRDNEAVGDTNFVVDYFRLTADRRMLFGGRASYSGVHPRDLAANMKPRLAKVFPSLAGARIDFSWGGHIGITSNRLPNAGRHGKALYFAQGYSGQGAVLAGFFGKLMAQAILGDAGKLDVFSRIEHRPFPGGLLRRPALSLGMLYYRIRDLLG